MSLILPAHVPHPACDIDRPKGGKDLGDLPVWDFSSLYASDEAPEIARDFDWLEQECAAFAADYEGKLAGLASGALLDCVVRYERIEQVAGRLMSFFGLRYYQNTVDPSRAKAMSDAQDRVTTATTPLVFFSLELNRIPDADFDATLAANADLARYKPVFERMRAMRPHQLSDELEKFLHDQSTVGAAAWNRLFDETMAGLEFPVAGEDEPLGLESTLNLLTDRDRSRREAGARALAEVFGANIRLFAR
ncbi:MAG: oligoendopeptidase F, partial [Rhodobacteraceae bacterium]|nr:oligoendopeptidase F [Paracoccaceae bacterium]